MTNNEACKKLQKLELQYKDKFLTIKLAIFKDLVNTINNLPNH